MDNLPIEIVDLILDFLSNERSTLQACCVISKSWVHRVRKHLFAHVQFNVPRPSIESWIKTFPDPSNSPAHLSRTLSIRGEPVVVVASLHARPWVRAFDKIVNLNLEISWWDNFETSTRSLIPFHGLSPSLESLSITCLPIPPSDIFNFICSFHFLEDFTLNLTAIYEITDTSPTIPSTSPKLTGSLHLAMKSGVQSTVRRFLDLPGGLHFSKISLFWLDRDAGSAADLISRCFDSLQSLRIGYTYSCITPAPPSLDLSNATKLKAVEFHWNTQDIQWITETLQTVNSEHLQQIFVYVSTSFVHPVAETVKRGWQELDSLLIGLWTSRSIHPTVTFRRTSAQMFARGFGSVLLPELAERGGFGVVRGQDNCVEIVVTV